MLTFAGNTATALAQNGLPNITGLHRLLGKMLTYRYIACNDAITLTLMLPIDASCKENGGKTQKKHTQATPAQCAKKKDAN